MNKQTQCVRSGFFGVYSPYLALLIVVGLLVSPCWGKGKGRAKKGDSSHHFFSFDDAPYYTSPDKRVGVKLLINPTKVGPSIAAIQHLTFLPGAHIKSHRHVYVTEIIYVLKGNLTLRIDKEIKIMGPDTTAFIPPKTFHEYLNDSSDVCQFLQYFSPSGPEEEYRNWEKPGDPTAKAAPAEPVVTEPQQVIAPALPAVPGSPKPVIGGIEDKSDSADPARPFELKLRPMQAPATGTRSLELKTRLNDAP